MSDDLEKCSPYIIMNYAKFINKVGSRIAFISRE